MKAVGVLGVLLATVLLMTTACIVFPLLLTRRRADLDGAGPYLLYFAAIGLGFMLIEISQLQRLTIFLGHPAYSLSVVLFSLLVSSGIGSLSTARCDGSAGVAQAAPGARLSLTLIAFGLADTADRPPVRVVVHAGADRAGDRAAVPGGVLHGHGVPPGHAPRAQARAAARAVVVGRQRRRVGVRVGARGGDRDRRGDLGGVLDWQPAVIWWRWGRCASRCQIPSSKLQAPTTPNFQRPNEPPNPNPQREPLRTRLDWDLTWDLLGSGLGISDLGIW